MPYSLWGYMVIMRYKAAWRADWPDTPMAHEWRIIATFLNGCKKRKNTQ